MEMLGKKVGGPVSDKDDLLLKKEWRRVRLDRLLGQYILYSQFTIAVQHPDRSDDTAVPDVVAANVKEDVQKAYSLNIEIIRGGGL